MSCGGKKIVLNPNPLYISRRHDAEHRKCDRFKLVGIQISTFALYSSRMFKENGNNSGGHLEVSSASSQLLQSVDGDEPATTC